jgi:hypothetical protein
MNIEERYLKDFKKIKKLYIHITPKRKEESCIDEEQYHMQLDTLIIQFIKELGYDQIAKEYQEARLWFWYS